MKYAVTVIIEAASADDAEEVLVDALGFAAKTVPVAYEGLDTVEILWVEGVVE